MSDRRRVAAITTFALAALLAVETSARAWHGCSCGGSSTCVCSRPCAAGIAPLRPVPLTSALVRVRVPERAEVWINGRAMTASGEFRFYRARSMGEPNKYVWRVQAVIVRPGSDLKTPVKEVVLQAGDYHELVFAPAEFRAGQ